MAPFELQVWDFKERTWNYVRGVANPPITWLALGVDTWGYRIVRIADGSVVNEDIEGLDIS